MALDPRIPLQAFAVQPENPLDVYGRIQQLQALGDERKLRALQTQQAQMQMEEYQRKRQQEQNIRDAALGAVRPQHTTYNTGGLNVGGMELPGNNVTVQGPAQLDRAAFLQNLNGSDPMAAMDFQNQWAAQEAAQRNANLETQNKYADLQVKLGTISKNDREQLADALTTYGKLVGGILMTPEQNRPVAYKIARNAGMSHPNPLVRQMAANAPEQYTPDMVPSLQMGLNEAMSVADIAKQVYPEKKTPSVEQQQMDSWLKRPGNKGKDAADFLVWKNRNSPTILKDASGSGGTGAGNTPNGGEADPMSNSLLARLGMSANAFRYIVGQTTQLPRDKQSRQAAANEAQAWSRKANIDITSIPAQYAAQMDVLKSNIQRLNNTKIMEQELSGTVQNLQEVIGKDFSNVKLANVWKIWAGEQVNDEKAQQYAFHLGQLRNELAAYYAAAAGRPGSGITITDLQEAERTIKNGIAAGGLNGVANAVHNSTLKMGPIMQDSVDRAEQSIWRLFGQSKTKQHNNTGSGAVEEYVRDPNTGKLVRK